MSVGDFAFVLSVVAAMFVFAVTLFTVAWSTNRKSEAPRAPRRRSGSLPSGDA